MATGLGTAEIDFGAHPGANEASVAVTGQGTISATSKVEAYIMADDTTTDHTATDHRYVGLWLALTCGTPVAATGFTIYGRSDQKLHGKFAVRWVWAD
jgi:predicted glycoside hydrolase/deacetylase ChbG (UPF0249 family)